MMKYDNSFGEFLNEIGRYPLLTQEQEVMLARKVQRLIELEERVRNGEELTPAEERAVRQGRKAKERMINCNLRMVVSIAKKYVKRTAHLTMLDLVQEGTLGLLRGVEKFDPARGYKFSTYAYWWIRQGMARAIAQQDSTIRMPNPVAEKLPRLKACVQRLSQQLGRMPTRQEVADEVGTTVEELWLMCERAGTPVSLDNTLQEEGDPLINLIPDDRYYADEAIFLVDDHWKLERALATLNERSRLIIEARHELNGQEPRPYSQLGRELGISREMVRQIEMRALRQMRVAMSQASPLADPKLLTKLPSHEEKRSGLFWLRRGAEKEKQLQLANATDRVRK